MPAEYLTLIILTLTLICWTNADFLPCQEFSWWNAEQKKCAQCTKCEGQEIVVRSCLADRDTECGSVNDLELDWLVLTKTDANWKERRKDNLILLNKANSNDESEFDWQAAALILALISCILFFIVAAVVLLQHMKQWRHMEYRLNRDVEELSAKLMARLAEIQIVENGTFLIENPIKGQIRRPLEVQCIYLDQFLANKDITLNSMDRGNIYIEETSCKD